MSLERKLHLREGEEIIEIIRQSSTGHAFRYFLVFSGLLANTFFTYWFWTKGVEAKITYGIIWLLGLYIIFSTWYISRSNYLVVTSERIFDINRESFLKETISSLEFFEIDDVVVEKRGLLHSILNYGHLTINPREGRYRFEMSWVKRPEFFQNLLQERKSARVQKSRKLGKDDLLKQFVQTIPELTEPELTLVYQKINSRLLRLADRSSEKNEEVV